MLMEVSALREQLGVSTLVICDCRFSLQDKSAGRRDYECAHIPGAVYLDLERDLSGPVGPHGGRHPLPNPHVLAGKLGASGVGPESSVVVYDDGGGFAPRAWWLLRWLGHSAVSVLNGGWCAWQAAQAPTTAAVVAPRPRTLRPSVQTDRVVCAEDVARIAAGADDGWLLDARAPARYLGQYEPLDPQAGHIPGARNLPWESALRSDGRWLDASAQRARFERVAAPAASAATAPAPTATGAEDESSLPRRAQTSVSYCGSGVTACANLFAMELAGLPGGRLYAGSWSDWCSYAHHPIATGPETTR